MTIGMTAAFAGLAVAGAAHAAFVGYECDVTAVGGLAKIQVFAKFNGATDTVLNCFHFNRVVGTPVPVFHHSDALTGCMDSTTAGSWSPQFVCPPGAMDSYVCIGGGEGFASGNSTNADPDWGPSGFNSAQIPFLGAPGNTTNGPGWFNSNPPNLQGRVNAQGRVKIGQFVVGANEGPFLFFLKIGYNSGQPGSVVQFGEGTFCIPAPGAIALLGLAGLAGRRRR